MQVTKDKFIIAFLLFSFIAFFVGQSPIRADATTDTQKAIIKTIDETNKTITFQIKNSDKEIVARNVSDSDLKLAKKHASDKSFTYKIKIAADNTLASLKTAQNKINYKLVFSILVPIFVVMILLNLD